MTAGATKWCACALTLLAAATQGELPRDPTSCGTNIVSATVVASYCSHRAGNEDAVDLMILWRGRAGWFQRGLTGQFGAGGTRTLGHDRAGLISEHRVYDDIRIAFSADFDAGTVMIDEASVPIRLENVNAVLVDGVDRGDRRHIAQTLRIAPRVPLGGDPNLRLIRGSRTLLRFLQCDVPMPVPPAATSQLAVITVCDKLAAGEK